MIFGRYSKKTSKSESSQPRLIIKRNPREISFSPDILARQRKWFRLLEMNRWEAEAAGEALAEIEDNFADFCPRPYHQEKQNAGQN